MNGRAHHGAVIAPGVLLGAGLGGFLDGVVFHQILQWHHMLSGVRPPTDLISMKVNVLWDGLFHAFAWMMTAAGVALLWKAGMRREAPWSTTAFAGGITLGLGAFNLVEGTIDHHLLGIHHVRPGEDQLAWDLAFLGLGVLLVATGIGLIRAVSVSTKRKSVLRRHAPQV